MNILIPMAGRGQRFIDAGFEVPKPFLPIDGKPMIERVVKNVTPPDRPCRIILLCHADYCCKASHLGEIVPVQFLTEGAACTCLLAKEYIDTDESLLIANSDQLVDWEVLTFLEAAGWNSWDAGIVTLPSSNPRYSFAEVDRDRVVRVAEKKPISNHATVGIYWWKRGRDFVNSAERMIADNDRFNGEFYVCPTYNYMPRHKTIGYFNVEAEAAHFLGTPESYREYCRQLGCPVK